MITHFETVITLLGVVIGWLSALVVGVWRARGWMDRRTTAERELARAQKELAEAVKGLTESQELMHSENRERFAVIERRLDGDGRGRSYAARR